MKKNNFKYYFNIILIAVCYLVNNTVFSQNVIQYKNENTNLIISPHLLIFEDQTNNLDINDIKTKEFRLTKNKVPNLGISESTFWIKIPINNLSNDNELILNLSLPTLDNVELFYPTEKEEYHSILTGENFPFNQRKYKDPNYLFDLNIPQGETKIYFLKISSKEGIQLPITLGTKHSIFNSLKNRSLISGVYFGIMLVMILYNLFIYFSVKDKSYIYYVIYIILILLTQTSLQGYPFQYLWPNSPLIAQNSLFIFPSLVGIASMVFMNIFLKVKFYNKTLFNAFLLLSIPYLISIFFALIKYYKYSFILMEVNAMLVSVYMLYTSIYILRKGYQPAKYFLAAWLVFLCGVIIYILKDFEVLPFNNFTRYTMHIGSAIETVLLSLALASRINIYKQERLDALEEKEKLVREQNIILEKTVLERTQELKNTLVNLKETQSQLVDSEKMSSLGQLTAGIAHEINNPINFVSSNIPPLKQDLDDIYAIIKKYEEITPENITEKLNEIDVLKTELDFEYLKTELPTIIDGIEDGAKRTQEIVSGLRNFSRLDENDLQLANINEGINSTLILIQNKLNEIQVTKNLADIPNIECYPGKLNQLFMNIIDNAIGAIKAKKIAQKGELTISTYNDANSVYLKIKDNGIGMNAETKNKMFDPFYTTKPVGSGTGLGLSIAHTIIKNHNADIEVKTEENIGTEITLKLPIKH